MKKLTLKSTNKNCMPAAEPAGYKSGGQVKPKKKPKGYAAGGKVKGILLNE